MWTVKNYIYKFWGILFPTKCFGCKDSDEILCKSCLEKCKRNVDFLGLNTISVYSFKDPLIKKIIHAIKYHHRRDLIGPVAQKLANEINNNYFNDSTKSRETFILIPIPMHRLRKYTRGYNQAELLAKNISEILKIPMEDSILQRAKFIKQQVKTNTKSSRINNQKNSFNVTRSVKNMNIILVDDVITTGATMDEARKILFKNGAEDVRAITIAH